MNTYIELIKGIALENKYTDWYINIVSRAKDRISSPTKKGGRREAKSIFGYVEGHHIYPRCMCSKDQDVAYENYAYLTAREHFICHWLLCKMFTGDSMYKMMHAFSALANISQNHKREVSARQYETILRNSSLARAEPCRKTMTGRKKSPEQIEKMRIAWTRRERGIKLSDEHKKKISESSKGRIVSEQTRMKLSIANSGKKLSPEQRKKISDTRKANRIGVEENGPLFGKRKHINIETLETAYLKPSDVTENFILIAEYRKMQSKGNAMNDPKNRKKVGDSKVGRKLAFNPQTGEKRFVYPDNIPTGFVI